MSDSIAGPVRFAGGFQDDCAHREMNSLQTATSGKPQQMGWGDGPTLEWAVSVSMSAAVGLGRDAAERFGRHGFACALHGKDCLASGPVRCCWVVPYDAIANSSDLKT